MGLIDFLRARRLRLAALVLVLPLAAGLAAYLVFAGRPHQYLASVQVAVPDNVVNSDSTIGLYIANFDQALTDEPLLDQVHRTSGVSAADLSSLSASRVQLTSRLEVDLLSTSRMPAIGRAVTAAAAAVRLELAHQGLDVAQAAVDQAQHAVDAAQQALADYQASIGTLFPSTTYNNLQASIRGLQNSVVEATAIHDTAQVTALNRQIATLQGQAAALAPQVRRAQLLTNDISAKTDKLRSVQQTLEGKQTLAITADNPADLGNVTVEPAPRALMLLLVVGGAALVALLLVVAGVLIRFALWRRARLGPVAAVPAPAG